MDLSALSASAPAAQGSGSYLFSLQHSAAELSTPDALTCSSGMALGPSHSSTGGSGEPGMDMALAHHPAPLSQPPGRRRGYFIPTDSSSGGFSSLSGHRCGDSGPAGMATSDYKSRRERSERGEAVSGVYRRWCLSSTPC